ncbi:uncharacterized protein [Spinacia oleracea]|uniref:RNase H type-1 domain-containing protein n=1 Tax=Spinacia oleracea TaxID=3562 RepID=A0ABM3RSG8_SPIOL|nr:uncharacterized protein LOC130472141 [Spinacia oleracea]
MMLHLEDSQSTKSSCEKVRNTIDAFCKISGEAINIDKSCVIFSPNTPESVKHELKQVLGTPCSEKLGKYLGCDVEIDGRSSKDFQPLVDKIHKKTLSWKHLSLSQAVRLVLINAILAALSSNVLAVFKVPKKITVQINAALMRYWWMGSANNRGIRWTKRTILELPKGLGGVGLRNVETYNKASLAKQAFRIQNTPSLLISRVMKAAYKNSPVEAILNKDIHCRASWGFRGLCKSVQEISTSVGRVIHRGDIDIRQDIWLPSKKVSFKNREVERGSGVVKVKDLFHPQEKKWNSQLIWATFSPNTAREILSMHISQEDKDDQVCWIDNKMGQPTVKSIYNQLILEKCPRQISISESKFWKRLWKSDMMPKWKIFIWKIMIRAVAIKSNLQKRGMRVDGRDCSMSNHIWKASSLGINAGVNQHIDIREWIKNFMCLFWNEDGSHSSRVLMFVATLWSIWLHRNEFFFRNTEPNPSNILQLVEKHVKKAMEVVKKNRRPECKHQYQTIREKVVEIKGCHDRGTTSLIIVGSWKKNRKKDYGDAAIGWKIMDNNSLVAQDGQKVKALDPCQAEMKAILFAMQRVDQLHIGSIRILTNSRFIINTFKSYPACRMDLVTICGDIIRVANALDNCSIEYCNKDKIRNVKNIAVGARKDR